MIRLLAVQTQKSATLIATSLLADIQSGFLSERCQYRSAETFPLIRVLILTTVLWGGAYPGIALAQGERKGPSQPSKSGLSPAQPVLTPAQLDLPTTETAGVPKEAKLKPLDGLVVTKPGTVIEEVDIHGQVYIQAENVTLRNCKVTYGGYAPVRISQGLHGVTVQDCTIDGLGQGSGSHGITGAGTFLRNDISGVENGINVEANIPTVIRGNYIHDLQAVEDPHYDGIQIFGDNKDVIVEGNTVINSQPGVSAVFVANTFGSVDNVRIANNYLSGGGYPLYFSGTYTSAPMTNVIWENNYVVRGGWGYEYIRADSYGNTPHRERNIQVSRTIPPN